MLQILRSLFGNNLKEALRREDIACIAVSRPGTSAARSLAAAWRMPVTMPIANEATPSRPVITSPANNSFNKTGEVTLSGRGISVSARVEIVGVDELPVGGSKRFHYPGKNDDCILVRTGPQVQDAIGLTVAGGREERDG